MDIITLMRKMSIIKHLTSSLKTESAMLCGTSAAILACSIRDEKMLNTKIGMDINSIGRCSRCFRSIEKLRERGREGEMVREDENENDIEGVEY